MAAGVGRNMGDGRPLERSSFGAGETSLAVAFASRREEADRLSFIDATQAVLAVNRRFYDAFEARDLDAMSDLWERSERSTCTHPGWATLRGWGRIASSFFALFQGPQSLQFVLTEERAQVVGDVAWVSVDENLLGAQGGATVAALNVFVRAEDGEWRLVCHHGSVVTTQVEVETGPNER